MSVLTLLNPIFFPETLDLQDCGLPGDLSSLFLHSNASSIEFLRLGGNDLEGSISSEISQLSELQTLDLSDTLIEGEIPPEMYRLSKLRDLYLQNANLHGELSEDFGLLNQTIRTIALNGNNFHGDVPKAFDYCLHLGMLVWLACSTGKVFYFRPCLSHFFFFLAEEYLDLLDNPLITGRVSKAICERRRFINSLYTENRADEIYVLGIPCGVECSCCGFRLECKEPP